MSRVQDDLALFSNSTNIRDSDYVRSLYLLLMVSNVLFESPGGFCFGVNGEPAGFAKYKGDEGEVGPQGPQGPAG